VSINPEDFQVKANKYKLLYVVKKGAPTAPHTSPSKGPGVGAVSFLVVVQFFDCSNLDTIDDYRHTSES
jgi:hypothetical protein